MPRGDIIGGLKAALARGQSLKQAMMSFYNAGYKKEDIEEAARTLTQHPQQPISQQQTQVQQPKKQNRFMQILKSIKKPKQEPIKKQAPTQPVQTPKSPTQKISSYEKTPDRPKKKILILILIFALLALIGILVAVFFFKEELTDFFSGLF